MNDQACVVFSVTSQKYCVEIEKVREIYGAKDSMYVPGSPDYIDGVVNIRGEIVCIVNLAKKLHLQAENTKKDAPLIIVEINDITVGFLVDSVLGIIHVNDNQYSVTPQILVKKSPFIQGVVKTDNEMIMLLDLENTLNDDELEEVKNINEEHASK